MTCRLQLQAWVAGAWEYGSSELKVQCWNTMPILSKLAKFLKHMCQMR
jgi:hypothetical protein